MSEAHDGGAAQLVHPGAPFRCRKGRRFQGETVPRTDVRFLNSCSSVQELAHHGGRDNNGKLSIWNPQFCDGDHIYIRKVVMTIT